MSDDDDDDDDDECLKICFAFLAISICVENSKSCAYKFIHSMLLADAVCIVFVCKYMQQNSSALNIAQKPPKSMLMKIGLLSFAKETTAKNFRKADETISKDQDVAKKGIPALKAVTAYFANAVLLLWQYR